MGLIGPQFLQGVAVTEGVTFLEFTEKSVFKGSVQKPIYRGDCLKRGAWTFSKLKGGAWKNREG